MADEQPRGDQERRRHNKPCGPAVDQAGTAHDKTFWRGIAAQKFAVPAGESVTVLVRKLSGCLGSPDPELRDGWMHSAAHTADLLNFLGRSRYLTKDQQAAILSAVSAKLDQIPEVLTHGEDERLGRAVLSIVARPDLDASGFEKWIASLAPVRPAGEPAPAGLATAQNRKNLVVSLFALLSTDPRDLPTLQAARAAVLPVLKRLHGVG